MIFKYFLILSFSLSILCCPYESDVDLFGNDLYFSFALNAGECCKKCSLEPDCKAWTFVLPNLTCWIKNDIGERRLNVKSSKSSINILTILFQFTIYNLKNVFINCVKN